MAKKRRISDQAATDWVGGVAYLLPKEQFQTLYEDYPFPDAVDMAEEVILWPDLRRPPQDLLLRWAVDVDEGRAQVRPQVAAAFRKRMEQYDRNLARRTIKGTARASQAFSRLLKKVLEMAEAGQIDERLFDLLAKSSSNYMHSNNGTGFIYRELVGGGKTANAQPNMFVRGNVRIVTNHEPRKLSSGERRTARQIAAPLEAQFVEV